MRAIAAVVVPWLVWGLLDNAIYEGLRITVPDSFGMEGQPTTAMLLVFLLLRGVYSLVAGWLAARIAGGGANAIRVAVVLLLVTGVAAQARHWAMVPVWYHLLFLASIVPCAGFGAKLGKGSRA